MVSNRRSFLVQVGATASYLQLDVAVIGGGTGGIAAALAPRSAVLNPDRIELSGGTTSRIPASVPA